MSRRAVTEATTVLVIVTAALLWLVLAASPTLLHAAGWYRSAAWTRFLFFPICHQDSSRCFVMLGSAMALCARCTGLYSGFLAGAVCLTARVLRGGAIPPPPRGRLLVLAAAPSVAQWLAAASGLASDLAAARAATGAIFGFTVAFYFVFATHHMRAALAAEVRRLFAPGGRVDAETS